MQEKTNLLPHKGLDLQRLTRYRSWVYFVTFVAYANSHFSRKSYTNVKVQLKGSVGLDPILLSQMDTTFMFFYAIGSFFSGQLGDTFYPPLIIGLGLIGSAACVFALVVSVWFDVESQPNLAHFLLLLFWMLHGLFQSTGGPVGTAVMGNWVNKKYRGFIFGVWTCHQYVGNIVAALVASAILSSGLRWYWALIVPVLANVAWGLVVMAFLPATPQQVDLETEDTIAAASDSKSTDPVKDLAPIGFFRAFRIPNVAQYALAFGFFKLINYALFFWLPYFLAQHYTPEQSNLISTLYDVGMMPGGIIVGYVSDLYGGRRACVIVTFMFLLVPLLILFSQAADTLPALALLVLLGFMGVLVGGPNNIITSAVSADLAEHPDVKGNSRALGTVTGIINGSGSITAAIGLLFIGPMQVSWGWDSVWYFLIVCTVLGTLLISRMVYFELYPKSEAEDAPNGYHSVQTGESKA